MNLKQLLCITLIVVPTTSFAHSEDSLYEKAKKHKSEIAIGATLIGALGGLIYWCCSRNIKSEVKNHSANYQSLEANYRLYFSTINQNNPDILADLVGRNGSTMQQFVTGLERDLNAIRGMIRQLDAIIVDYPNENYRAPHVRALAETLEVSMSSIADFAYQFRGHYALEKIYREMVNEYSDECNIPQTISAFTEAQIMILANSKLHLARDPYPLIGYATHVMTGVDTLNRGINYYDRSRNGVESPRYRWTLHLRHILTLIKDALVVAPQYGLQKKEHAAYQQKNALIIAEQQKAAAEQRKAEAADREAQAKQQLARSAQDQARTAQWQLSLETSKFEEKKRKQKAKELRQAQQHAQQIFPVSHVSAHTNTSNHR